MNLTRRVNALVAATLVMALPCTALAEPPVVAPPVAEAPVTAPPVAEAPVAAAPVAAPPVAEAPVAAAPVVAAPVAAAPVAPAPAEVDRKKFRAQRGAMAIAGFSTLATTYLMTSVQGAIAIDKAHKSGTDPSTGLDRKPDPDAVTGGKWLMVPVVGPFAAAHYMPKATGRWLAVFSGTIQVSTLIIGVIGIAGLRRTRPMRRPQFFGSVAQSGAFVGVRGRF